MTPYRERLQAGAYEPGAAAAEQQEAQEAAQQKPPAQPAPKSKSAKS